MATFKFIVRPNRVNDEGNTLVFIQYSSKDERALISTGVQIPVKHYDASEYHKIKKKVTGRTGLILALDTKMNNVKEARNKCIELNEPDTPRNVKYRLEQLEHKAIAEDEKKHLSFWDVYDRFVEHQKVEQSYLTYKQYVWFKTLLQDFEKHSKRTLTLDSIDMDFYTDFKKYMLGVLEYSESTMNGKIKNIKVFMNWCRKQGKYNISVDYLNFKRTKENIKVIHLTESELRKLINFNPPSNRKALEKVRDLFVFQCCTGLRISDLKRVGKHHFEGDTLVMTSHKNENKIRIPLSTRAKQIIEKYDYQLPRYAEPVYRRQIKDLCELAKINSKVEVTIKKDGKKVHTTREKHELISTHTSVKTFINLCVDAGMRPKDVAAMTGKSVKVLIDHYYSKDSNEESIRKIAAFA